MDFTAFYDISPLYEHITGIQNDMANHISRSHLHSFVKASGLDKSYSPQ